jgi:hypothetical protein
MCVWYAVAKWLHGVGHRYIAMNGMISVTYAIRIFLGNIYS